MKALPGWKELQQSGRTAPFERSEELRKKEGQRCRIRRMTDSKEPLGRNKKGKCRRR